MEKNTWRLIRSEAYTNIQKVNKDHDIKHYSEKHPETFKHFSYFDTLEEAKYKSLEYLRAQRVLVATKLNDIDDSIIAILQGINHWPSTNKDREIILKELKELTKKEKE